MTSSTIYTPDGEPCKLHLPRFSLEKIANAKRDKVFEIFSNFENYEKLLPQHFPSVRRRSTRENVSVVEEHLVLGERELVIMAKHVTQNPVSHDVFVIGGDAKGSRISQQFIDLSVGTKIIVNVELKFKGKLKISSIFAKNNFEKEYCRILDDFILLAES